MAAADAVRAIELIVAQHETQNNQAAPLIIPQGLTGVDSDSLASLLRSIFSQDSAQKIATTLLQAPHLVTEKDLSLMCTLLANLRVRLQGYTDEANLDSFRALLIMLRFYMSSYLSNHPNHPELHNRISYLVDKVAGENKYYEDARLKQPIADLAKVFKQKGVSLLLSTTVNYNLGYTGFISYLFESATGDPSKTPNKDSIQQRQRSTCTIS